MHDNHTNHPLNNYFEKDAIKVSELKHFPYNSFEEFKRAFRIGEIIDFQVDPYHARDWASKSPESPVEHRLFHKVVEYLQYIIILFYLLFAIILSNIWLMPYSIVPMLFMQFCGPKRNTVIKIHYFIIFYILLAYFVLNTLFNPLYWFPMLLNYLAFIKIYSDSEQTSRSMILHNEKTLCEFWKQRKLVLSMKPKDIDSKFTQLSQYWKYVDGQQFDYEDIKKEWNDYMGLDK